MRYKIPQMGKYICIHFGDCHRTTEAARAMVSSASSGIEIELVRGMLGRVIRGNKRSLNRWQVFERK
jgi:hypothetical protein